jgi:L-ribulose-5-phosphate 4-epimerase
MSEDLREQVYRANKELPRLGLVTFTWGNVSGIDRDAGLILIKPSGVEYDDLTPDDLVGMTPDGGRVEGRLDPSSDTKTHLELYRAFPGIGGVVHTHSPYATAWAQAGEDLLCYGTTHADYFYGPVPCARSLTEEEVGEDYEGNTGKVIVETFAARGIDPLHTPGVICRNHGVFTWGKDAAEAVYHAAVLEEVAKMAAFTRQIRPDAPPAPQYIQDKHFFRKHGEGAYYGQNKPIS